MEDSGSEDIPIPPLPHSALASDHGDLAPTASITLEKLREEKRALVDQRDQLRRELDRLLDSVAAPAPAPSTVPATPHCHKKPEKKRRRMTSSSSSSTFTSSSSTSSSSSSSSDRERKKKKKKKKRTNLRSFGKRKAGRAGWEPDTEMISGVGETEDDISSLIAPVLMPLGLDGVRRDPTGPVTIASDGEQFAVPPYTPGTTLQSYAKDLQQFVASCPQLRKKIEDMKKEYKLLPIKNKFRN
nr:uncharacterized protein LOC129424301 [Misgurnus anguillicaudatus]